MLIVVLTMLVVRYFVMLEWMKSSSIGMKFQLNNFDFSMLIVAVIALTAAGNVINDYFDQKVDRVNKPDQVIVGKTVKRRVAIILHQGLNILAVLSTIYVCLRTSFWWPLILPIFIATLLWWYSPVLKKRVFIGNLAVAFCTACVPIWAALFEIHALQVKYQDMLIDGADFFSHMWMRIIAVSLFAFILTLLREAVKDMEDMEGDALGEYHTIPIVYGIEKTKKYLYALMVAFLLGMALVMWKMHSFMDLAIQIVLIVIPTILLFISIRKAQVQKDFRGASNLLKIISVLGIVALVIILG